MPDFSQWSFNIESRRNAELHCLTATYRVTGDVVRGTWVDDRSAERSHIDANLLIAGVGGCVEPNYKTVRYVVHEDVDTLGPEVSRDDWEPAC